MTLPPETVRDTASLYLVPAELVAPHRYVPLSEICELVMTSEGEPCKYTSHVISHDIPHDTPNDIAHEIPLNWSPFKAYTRNGYGPN